MIRRALLEFSAAAMTVAFLSLAAAVLNVGAVPTRCLNEGASLCGMLWSFGAVVDAVWIGGLLGVAWLTIRYHRTLAARIRGVVSA